MAFSSDELANIAVAVLDHYDRSGPNLQQEEEHPLVDALEAGKKPFAAGKDKLVSTVKGDRTVTLQGYTHNDTVSYQNPANLKQVYYPWKELHAGITCTFTELKKAGISIEESGANQKPVRHSDSEMEVIVDLLTDKVEQMNSDVDNAWAQMLWADGTASANNVPGIQSFILNDPTTSTVIGGLNQSTVTWWRNRATLGIATAVDSGETPISDVLQKEFRQLRRYAQGGVKHVMLAGSAFLESVDKELRRNGSFTQTGWAGGTIDLGINNPKMKGVALQYDPTLDDLGFSKYLYVLDMKAIRLRPMKNEEWKKFNPARPQDQYVMYQGMTWTGALECLQRNTSGVYTIA